MNFRMAEIQDLLKAIRDALTTTQRSQKDDDIALPLFDPERNDCGAASWCDSIEVLAKEFDWSSIKTAAKAGKALKGSALRWFESWEPAGGRSWENFRIDIINIYPEKKNLSERLSKAVLYSSDSAESYSEYAREKLRLLRNTKIAFSEIQLVEIICGGISDVDIRMASLNNGAATTSALITLLSTYVKAKKRSLDHNKDIGTSGPSGAKRSKFSSEKKCFTCNKMGHVQTECFRNKQVQITSLAPQVFRSTDFRSKVCTYCKKLGHTEAVCYHKQRSESNNTASITVAPNNEVNFLDKPN